MMADLSDHAIKISVPTAPLAGLDPVPDPIDDPKDICGGATNAELKDQMAYVPEEYQDVEVASSSGLKNTSKDDHGTSIHDDEVLTDSNPKNDHSEADMSGQDKVLKKPDKILPCPRCNSLNTKFCYYNNHNVNQPRHFCKNCQRYWTAGGTMRNLPVGAGRRKTKHSLQQQNHSGGLSAPMKPLMGNDVVTKLGTETPSCKPVTSVLNLGEQKRNAEMVISAGGENDKEPTGSSSMTPNCINNDFPKLEAHNEQTGSPGFCNGIHPMHPLQGFPGPPWPYFWDLGWNNAAAMAASNSSFANGIPNPFPWGPPVNLLDPSLCAPTVPFPIMPASFWACISSWPNEAWSAPWRGSINDSHTLGKHSRDDSLQGEEKVEKKSLWIPKTLRIDDPKEAAKSSIWSTLGIRPDESIKRGSLFRGFQSSNESSSYASDAAKILHANPAALSRSQTFQESK